jgi:hypothetical protein
LIASARSGFIQLAAQFVTKMIDRNHGGLVENLAE